MQSSIAVLSLFARGYVLPVIHAIALALFYFAFWLLLSGYFTPMLLGFGVISCGLVFLFAHRMGVGDREALPWGQLRAIASYWPWLIVEIVKSNIDVIKRILDPALPINPTIIRYQTSHHTDMGRVIYANSVTLTPGTITLRLEGDEVEVHVLARELAVDLAGSEMDRRTRALEGD